MSTENAAPIGSGLPTPPPRPSLAAQALRHAAADPDRLAVVDGATGERLTRGDLAERSASLAAGMAARGIGRGEIVALAMPDIAWWPVVALAAWHTGAAIAPLNPAWTAAEMGRVLALVRPRLGVAFGPAAAALEEGLDAAGIDAEVVVQGEAKDATPLERLLVGAAGDPFVPPHLAPGDLALVPFSSGLGGLPKGVRLNHETLSAASMQAVASLALDADSVALAAAGVFNAMGLVSSLCAPLTAGARIVTLPVPKTEPILAAMAKHRVTHATLPPPVVARCPSVRQAYGMTEALAISGPRGRPCEPATVGWLAAGTEARLVDPEAGRDVAPGQPGELWIRGPQVMDGYLDDPDATAAAITPDGWLRTGDLVAIRDDGQLVIKDRLEELIKVRGASVAPAELELVLREHPAVRDAAVVGRPDAERGEVPVAWVVLAGRASREDLISFVRARVTPHRRLRDVRIVDRLPRMPNAGLVRRALRDRERDEAGRR